MQVNLEISTVTTKIYSQYLRVLVLFIAISFG